MRGRGRGFIIAGAVIAAGCVAVLFLPVESWRTGRSPVPPLNLVPGGPPVAMARRVWVDTDAACGTAARVDSDDCLAILYLAHQPDIQIVGISTVAGNGALTVADRTVRTMVEQLAVAGRPPIPVYRGGPSPHSDAARALRRALSQPLTIVALGPLTNVASALEPDSPLMRRVTRLVAVMGRRRGHLFHPSEGSGSGSLFGHGPVFSDFNVVQDPQAAIAVVEMNLPMTLIPYDVARFVSIDAADLDRLAAEGAAARWVAARSRDWLAYWNASMGLTGFYPFDLLAAAYVASPAQFDCSYTTLWVEPASDTFPPYHDPVSVIVGHSYEMPVDPLASGQAIYCARVDAEVHRRLVDGLSSPDLHRRADSGPG